MYIVVEKEACILFKHFGEEEAGSCKDRKGLFSHSRQCGVTQGLFIFFRADGEHLKIVFLKGTLRRPATLKPSKRVLLNPPELVVLAGCFTGRMGLKVLLRELP